MCLKKINGLNKVKLVDAGFVWTEPHSRRIKVKLTIQKELDSGAKLQQAFVVEFAVQNQQCDDCQRSYTTHTWNSCVQVRQKVCAFQRMCMRSKAWLAASVSLRLARLPPLQAGCGAHVACAPRLRLCQAFSRMLWSQNSKSGPYIATLCRALVPSSYSVFAYADRTSQARA